MKKLNLDCNEEQHFPFFAPTNQLPYPAVKGMILITKSDFTLPARPDLLEWQTRESVIGVEDIKVKIAENGLSATLYKLVNNEEIEVGTIGIIEKDEAEKLKAINYVNYIIVSDIENHNFKFYGIDKENNQTLITTISNVDYDTYNNKIIEIEASAEVLNKKVDINKHQTDEAISNLDVKIDNVDNKLNTKIEANTTLINNNYDTLDTKIDNNFDIEKQDKTELTNNITAVDNKYQPTKDTQDNLIKPIIDIINMATSGGLVLAKAQNGVDIEWLNKLSLENVSASIDNEKHTITFYKTINGTQFEFLTMDKVDYIQVQNLSERLTKIDDNIYEASEPNYILAKTSDGINVDYRDPKTLIKFSSETIDNKIIIYLNGEKIFEINVPSPEIDGQYLIDNKFEDYEEGAGYKTTELIITDKKTNVEVYKEQLTDDTITITNTKTDNPSVSITKTYNLSGSDPQLKPDVEELKDNVNTLNNKINTHDTEIANSQADIIELREDKQDKLIAGNNITIDKNTNTISASGGENYVIKNFIRKSETNPEEIGTLGEFDINTEKEPLGFIKKIEIEGSLYKKENSEGKFTFENEIKDYKFTIEGQYRLNLVNLVTANVIKVNIRNGNGLDTFVQVPTINLATYVEVYSGPIVAQEIDFSKWNDGLYQVSLYNSTNNNYMILNNFYLYTNNINNIIKPNYVLKFTGGEYISTASPSTYMTSLTFIVDNTNKKFSTTLNNLIGYDKLKIEKI